MLLFRDSSIRRKLSMVIFCTSLLGLSIAGLAFEIYERASFRASLVEDLTAQADTLRLNITAALTCQMTAPPEEGARFKKEFVTFSRSISLDGENTGAVAIISDFSQLNAKMKRFREISVLVLIVSLLATVLVSQRLVGLITEPILQLAGLAERVSMKEDYTLRAVAVGKDELGKLVGSFNQMLERIQERDAALQNAKDQLELRVRERTEELQKEVTERMRAEKLQRIAYDATRLLAEADSMEEAMPEILEVGRAH